MKLGIYCAGGAGRDLLDLTEQIGGFETVVFIDDHLAGTIVNGAQVLSFPDFCRLYPPQAAHITLASGESSVLRPLFQRIKEQGYGLQTLIHPSVWVPGNCKIEDGVTVLDRVRIGPNSTLSTCSHLSVNTAIGHDVILGAFSNISMGCMVAGSCTIGEATYIGAGSVVRDEIIIGSNCIIGMGSMVLKDIPDHSLVYGSPAKVVRSITDDAHVF